MNAGRWQKSLSATPLPLAGAPGAAGTPEQTSGATRVMPVINIKMLEGRSREQKRELAEVFTREMVRICGANPASIHIVIEESSKENWAVAGQLLADRTQEAKS